MVLRCLFDGQQNQTNKPYDVTDDGLSWRFTDGENVIGEWCIEHFTCSNLFLFFKGVVGIQMFIILFSITFISMKDFIYFFK